MSSIKPVKRLITALNIIGAASSAVGKRGTFSKIGFVLPTIQLQIVVGFSSIEKIEDRSVSLRGGATLVSVQLAQFGQHASNGFSGSFRLL